jgi:hypothetical protein
MRYLLFLTASGLAVVLGGLAATTNAQTSRPFDSYTPPPSVSPYMNMLNNNGNPIVNYQLLVKPQLRQRELNQQSTAAIKQLQQQMGSEKPHAASTANQKLRTTGHAATRMNYSHYFPAMKR